MAKFSSLKEKIKELNTSGVGFMEGREKGELPKGVYAKDVILHIIKELTVIS